MNENRPPELYVFSPDRRLCYGAARMTTEMTEDIRFNSCSEVSIKVVDKICDPLTGKWINNPVYNHLEKNNLLYLCDDNEYFSFPNRTLRNDYGIESEIPYDYGRETSSGNVEMIYENKKKANSNDNNGVLNGFSLRPETHLHNISIFQGYNWENLSDITEFGFRKYRAWEPNFFKVSCINYVFIQPYDVVSIRNRMYKDVRGVDDKFLTFDIFFYTSEEANSYVGVLHVSYNWEDDARQHTIVNPVARFSINSLHTGDKLTIGENNTPTYDDITNFKELLKDGAYIRICATSNRADDDETTANKILFPSYYITTADNTTVIGWSFPYDGWLQIYSGYRFCEQIDNDISVGNHTVPLRWFVINNTEEQYDGNTCVKTVTAYSFEYTISNKSISLSEDTLPFYIPQQILETVNNNNWVVDKEKGVYDTTNNLRRGKQYIVSGILNRILDILPDWSVGHISSSLMTRYRKIDDVDNANLYSFLMNEVESKYQCYLVFDGDSMTISAYSQEDIVDDSNAILNWQNALKGLKITDQDANFMTALRIHTADDTYGIGLVNPTGNSYIYNFNSILDKLNFVADDSSNDPEHRNKITENGVTRNRTLKEAVIKWQEFTRNPNNLTILGIPITLYVGSGDNDPNVSSGQGNTIQYQTFTINSIEDYRNMAEKFLKANSNVAKCKISLQSQYNEYLKIIDKIGVMHSAKELSDSPISDEIVRTPHELHGYYTSGTTGLHAFASDDSLYMELLNASKCYHQIRMEYEAALNDYNSYKKVLQKVAKKTNINYNTQKNLTTNYSVSETLSILTPAEILALQPFIREGDWTNENNEFTDEYDEKDIIVTLTDTYNQAKSDMDLFISKPSYDFEVDMANWTQIPKMEKIWKQIKVGKTVYINTKDNEYALPIILELHKNYADKSDFKIKFTTNYKRKPYQYRFADLYSTISQVSITDNTFNFAE